MRVLGYRVFRASPEMGGCLRSWVMDSVWKRGENWATCERPGCGCPPAQHGGTTGCGFHASGSLEAIHGYLSLQRLQQDREELQEENLGPAGPSIVCGVVAGFGTVQLGSRGWRSSRCEIVALFGRSLPVEVMAGQYHVPLLPLPDDLDRAERLTREWGISLGEALHLPADFDARQSP
jgi:hypothetical protein